LEPRLFEIRRVLNDAGSLYFHVDYREVHYVKVLLDSLFGRECFLNEVIWAYDYGARTTQKVAVDAGPASLAPAPAPLGARCTRPSSR
jgi:hypothetical protein